MKKLYIIILFTFSFSLFTNLCTAQYDTILNFNGANGEYPYLGRVTVVGHKVFGMTEGGGANDSGSIFSLDTNGGGYKDLLDFTLSKSFGPKGSLIYSSGVLYGMAYQGGKNDSGCIFSIDTDGTHYKDLFDFTLRKGFLPNGSLLLSGGKLYGMTQDGGANYDGIVFSIDTNGNNFKDLLDFDGSNGKNPFGSLIISKGMLYGMTGYGGGSFDGNAFCIDTNGSKYYDLLDFSGANGQFPYGDLTYFKGKLYGMTYKGGAHDSGCIFSIDTNTSNAVYTDLLDCNHSTGIYPFGSLTYSEGTLYGMTSGGGASTLGYLFSIDTNGTSYSNLFNFNNTWGDIPYGSLAQAANSLYGMTEFGGEHGKGVVFRYQSPAIITITTNVTSVKCSGSNDGVATTTVSGGISPYTYSWSPIGGSNATATGLSAGTYTVYVHDTHGTEDTSVVVITQPVAIGVTTYTIPSDQKDCIGIAAVTVSGGTMPYTYSWSPTSKTTDTIQNLCEGIYCCIITDNNGCITTSCVLIHPDTISAVNNVTSNSSPITVSPNPSNGKFNVICHSERTEESQLISVFNVLGEQVLTETLRNAQGDNLINLSGEPNGIYLYRVIGENGDLIGVGKLIVQK